MTKEKIIEILNHHSDYLTPEFTVVDDFKFDELADKLLTQFELYAQQREMEAADKSFDAGKEYGFYEALNANAGDIPDKDTFLDQNFHNQKDKQ